MSNRHAIWCNWFNCQFGWKFSVVQRSGSGLAGEASSVVWGLCKRREDEIGPPSCVSCYLWWSEFTYRGCKLWPNVTQRASFTTCASSVSSGLFWVTTDPGWLGGGRLFDVLLMFSSMVFVLPTFQQVNISWNYWVPVRDYIYQLVSF